MTIPWLGSEILATLNYDNPPYAIAVELNSLAIDGRTNDEHCIVQCFNRIIYLVLVLYRDTWIHLVSHRRCTLQWRHNRCDSGSNHQPHDCLLDGLFRRRSKKTWSSASLAFMRGIHRGPVNSPHKGPVTRKMFPFGDVIMNCPTSRAASPSAPWTAITTNLCICPLKYFNQ